MCIFVCVRVCVLRLTGSLHYKFFRSLLSWVIDVSQPNSPYPSVSPEIMKSGGICGMPTDTVYVLVAACNRPDAVEKAYK